MMVKARSPSRPSPSLYFPWDRIRERAGLYSVRLHDLRHSYASWMLAAGVPVYDVARYMGSSARMLDLTYAHLVRGSEAAARERLDAFTATAADRLGQEWATT